MSTGYKPIKADLVAIYRLEFYKKQKNWKLSHEKKKKVVPSKPEKISPPVCSTVLNQTYNVETDVLETESAHNKAFVESGSDKNTPPNSPDGKASKEQIPQSNTDEPELKEQSQNEKWAESQERTNWLQDRLITKWRNWPQNADSRIWAQSPKENSASDWPAPKDCPDHQIRSQTYKDDPDRQIWSETSKNCSDRQIWSQTSKDCSDRQILSQISKDGLDRQIWSQTSKDCPDNQHLPKTPNDCPDNQHYWPKTPNDCKDNQHYWPKTPNDCPDSNWSQTTGDLPDRQIWLQASKDCPDPQIWAQTPYDRTNRKIWSSPKDLLPDSPQVTNNYPDTQISSRTKGDPGQWQIPKNNQYHPDINKLSQIKGDEILSQGDSGKRWPQMYKNTTDVWNPKDCQASIWSSPELGWKDGTGRDVEKGWPTTEIWSNVGQIQDAWIEEAGELQLEAGQCQAQLMVSAAEEWLQEPELCQWLDSADKASLDSVSEFMRGAHCAPHSSEMELRPPSECSVSPPALCQVSTSYLRAHVGAHVTALRALLEEAACRQQLLSTSRYEAYDSVYEVPTRDVASPPDFVAGSYKNIEEFEIGRGRGRLHRRIIGFGRGSGFRLQ